MNKKIPYIELYKSKTFTLWQTFKKIRSERVSFEFVSLNAASQSVMLIPLTEKNEIIFIKKYFPAHRKHDLVLPGGKIENSQSPMVTAKRELLEETGYNAGKLRKIFLIDILPAYIVAKTLCYLATSLKKGDKKYYDREETLKVLKIPLPKAMRLIKSGIISDSRTVACILYYFIFVQNQNRDRFPR